VIAERIAHDLALPSAFIHSVAKTASYEYKTYTIPKRTGGVRIIHHPSRRLKALQRWLLTNIIEPLPTHDAVMGYRIGRSTMDNARRHTGSNYLLRLDFSNFFESITSTDVRAYIADRSHLFSGWLTGDIEFFCSIVCRNDALTIGAPTSPALSNVLCFDLDQAIQNYCQVRDVSYTRYADDLFFSTRTPGILNSIEAEVTRICRNLRFPASLVLNPTKVRHSSKRRARRVTGVVLGSDERAYVGRRLKRKIRAQIHQLERLSPTERSSLAGLIAYVMGNDPSFINSLINKYGLERVREARQL
jgi:RNA-directed DNA polymerase